MLTAPQLPCCMFHRASALLLLFATDSGSHCFHPNGPHRVVGRRNNGTVYEMLSKMLAHNHHSTRAAIITNKFAFKLTKSQNPTKGSSYLQKHRLRMDRGSGGPEPSGSYNHLLLREQRFPKETMPRPNHRYNDNSQRPEPGTCILTSTLTGQFSSLANFGNR